MTIIESYSYLSNMLYIMIKNYTHEYIVHVAPHEFYLLEGINNPLENPSYIPFFKTSTNIS